LSSFFLNYANFLNYNVSDKFVGIGLLNWEPWVFNCYLNYFFYFICYFNY